MSKDSVKRKLDATEVGEPKKLKGEYVDCNGKCIDVDALRSQIVQEVTQQFQHKLVKLEDEVKHLKLLILSDESPVEKSPESLDKSKDENGQKLASIDRTSTGNKIASADGLGSSTETPVRKAPSLTVDATSAKKDKPTTKPTFGTSLFNINPTVATPTTSFLSQSSETPKDAVENSPRPVFGATSSFSSAGLDIAKAKKNIFDNLPSTATVDSETPAQPLTASFGANSKFGNAFQESLKKKSFLDSSSNLEDDLTATKSTPQQFKQVDLQPIKSIQTGEEDEISLYNTTAKLFELDLKNIGEGWKERGLGPLHLNQSKSNKNQIRLVMRSHGLLRVILNYKITPQTDFLKGLEASLNPGKYLRLNSVNSQGTPIQYLLKFGTEAVRDTLVDKAELVKKEIQQ